MIDKLLNSLESKRSFIIGIVTSFILINACAGQHKEKNTAAQEGAEAALKPVNKETSLSPKYLAGEWCYAYMEAGYSGDKQRDQQSITYKFMSYGSLLYQNNSNTPVEKEGSYKLNEGKLTILPALRFLPHEIYSVDEDRFVLGNSVTQLTFIRGPCAD